MVYIHIHISHIYIVMLLYLTQIMITPVINTSISCDIVPVMSLYLIQMMTTQVTIIVTPLDTLPYLNTGVSTIFSMRIISLLFSSWKIQKLHVIYVESYYNVQLLQPSRGYHFPQNKNSTKKYLHSIQTILHFHHPK